jgi:hypothetical protein
MTPPSSLLATCFRHVSCFAYSSILKMGMTYLSETSVDFQRTILRYIPEDETLDILTISTFTLKMWAVLPTFRSSSLSASFPTRCVLYYRIYKILSPSSLSSSFLPWTYELYCRRFADPYCLHIIDISFALIYNQPCLSKCKVFPNFLCIDMLNGPNLINNYVVKATETGIFVFACL